jgi:hypothetical protein
MHGAAGDYTPVGGIWSRHYNWLILKDSCREKDAFFHGRHDHRAVFLQRLQLWLGMLACERGVATHRTSCSCASGFSASVCLDEAGARLIYSLHAGRSCCNSGPAVSLHMQAIGWIRRYATRGRVACEHGFCLFPFACKESVDEEAMRRCWCVGRSRDAGRGFSPAACILLICFSLHGYVILPIFTTIWDIRRAWLSCRCRSCR